MMEMQANIRVDLQLLASSHLLSAYSTIGDLREHYPDLSFVKYIYLDPSEKKLKGKNPDSGLPLVADSHLTVTGQIDKIEQFVADATESKQS